MLSKEVNEMTLALMNQEKARFNQMMIDAMHEKDEKKYMEAMDGLCKRWILQALPKIAVSERAML